MRPVPEIQAELDLVRAESLACWSKAKDLWLEGEEMGSCRQYWALIQDLENELEAARRVPLATPPTPLLARAAPWVIVGSLVLGAGILWWRKK